MKKDISKEIGRKVQKFRHARNLTQEYVAERLDITTKYYASTERGEKQLSLEKLIALLDILGVTANDLFPANEETNAFDRAAYQKKILEAIDEFSSANQYAAAIITLNAIKDIK
jgi:transcriptional regulator with XRE-family HTH domain